MLSFYTRGRLWSDNHLDPGLGYCDARPRRLTRFESPLILRFLARDERLLLDWPLALRYPCLLGASEPSQSPASFRAWTPFPKDAAILRYIHHGIDVYQIDVSASAPEIAIQTAPPARGEGRFRLEWRSRHPENRDVVFFARYSNTAGRRWDRISLTTREQSLEVDFDDLPGGAECQLAVVGTDGVRTSVATTQTFAVAPKALIPTIVTPLDAEIILEAHGATLAGQAYDREQDRVETESLVWRSSIDGIVGRGGFLEGVRLSTGAHVLTLEAGEGERTASTQVRVTCSKT